MSYRISFSSQTHRFCWLKANVWKQTSAPPVAVRSWQQRNNVLQFGSVCHLFVLFLTPRYMRVSDCRWATKLICNSGLLWNGISKQVQREQELVYLAALRNTKWKGAYIEGLDTWQLAAGKSQTGFEYGQQRSLSKKKESAVDQAKREGGFTLLTPSCR